MSDPSNRPESRLARPSNASDALKRVDPTVAPLVEVDTSALTENDPAAAAQGFVASAAGELNAGLEPLSGPGEGASVTAMADGHLAMALATGAISTAAEGPSNLQRIAPLATSLLQALNSGQSPAQVIASVASPALSLASPKLGQAASIVGGASQVMNLAGGKPSPVATPMFVPTAAGVPDDNPLTGRSISDFASPPAGFTPPPVDDSQGVAAESVGGMLAQIQESSRLLRFYGPLSGDKQLFVQSISGSAGLSELGSCSLQLIALNADIDLKDVLSKNVTTTIKLASGEEMPLNGYVNRFGFSHADGGLAFYDATVVPWLWYLGKRVNSRIFQQMSVLDVLDELFGEYGGLADYTVRVAQRPEPVDYIVQYDESDLHFVSRLMEQAGLFYFFEHKRSSHQLVISDDSTDSAHCPPQEHHPVVRFNAGDRLDTEDGLTQLSAEREIQSTMAALNTYDYKNPGASLYVEQPSVAEQGDVPQLQVFSGNPAFVYPTSADGNLEAQRRMEVVEWQAKVFHATSECRGMLPGHTFQLTRHPWFESGDEENAKFLVVGFEFEAHNNHLSQQGGSLDGYTNRLLMIRRKIPYRPMNRHPKPAMRGPQMATVVGPKGQEIYTDQYGRIKVQFPWDRYGRNDESSSCWIRVSQPWAGRGWGAVAIPRINQEVIIDFFEGDPDRPVCIGRLFNTDQTPPYPLPDGAHMMGFHSNSTPGGGGHCEMVIHDRKGEELVNIHSQKDMATTVQNNQVCVVNGPHQINTVTKGGQTNTVKQSIVTESQESCIETTAKGSIDLESREDMITATAKQNVQVESTDADVTITAKTNLVLKASGHTISIGPDGILINGKTVKVTGPDGIYLNE